MKTGLGASFNDLFFRSITGSNNSDEYLLQSEFNQVTANIKKFNSHDIIELDINDPIYSNDLFINETNASDIKLVSRVKINRTDSTEEVRFNNGSMSKEEFVTAILETHQ